MSESLNALHGVYCILKIIPVNNILFCTEDYFYSERKHYIGSRVIIIENTTLAHKLEMYTDKALNYIFSNKFILTKKDDFFIVQDISGKEIKKIQENYIDANNEHLVGINQKKQKIYVRVYNRQLIVDKSFCLKLSFNVKLRRYLFYDISAKFIILFNENRQEILFGSLKPSSK